MDLFTQQNIVYNWKPENLNHEPLYLNQSDFIFVEKFGELVEKDVGSTITIFNKGDYVVLRENENRPKQLKKNLTFKYEFGEYGLVRIDVSYNRNFLDNGAEYSIILEYRDGLLTKKTIKGNNPLEAWYTEFEYDSKKRNSWIKEYDYNYNVLSIWEFIYDGNKLIEKKRYNNKGGLEYNCVNKFDNKGNIVRVDKYLFKKPDETMKYSYNEKNHVVKETFISHSRGYRTLSEAEQEKNFNYYVYEYYPNDLIKKATVKSRYAGRQGPDRVIEIINYSYDEYDNWIEKRIYAYDLTNTLVLSKKSVREIVYYKDAD